MTRARCGWASLLVAAVLICLPFAADAAAVYYAAPAGDLPAAHLRNATFDAVLPSGRIVTPLGTSVVTGMKALSVALSPDGRFAVVSNADPRGAGAPSAVDAHIFGGYSLTVVDTSTMQVTDRVALPGETYFAGIAAVHDPREARRSLIFVAGGASDAVYVFDLGADGRLTPDAVHVVAIAGPLDAALGDFRRSGPATLIAAADGRHVYVVNEIGDSVTAIDTSARAVNSPSRPVGFFPFGAALAGDRLWIANEGLMQSLRVTDPPLAPPFMPTPDDPLHASSLAWLDLTPRGDLRAGGSSDATALALDPVPDGRTIVGGAHPSAVAVTADGAYAFVAMANVDRIATDRLGRSAAGGRGHRVAIVRPRPLRHAAGGARSVTRRRAAVRRTRGAQCRRGARCARSDPFAPAGLASDGVVSDVIGALGGRSHAVCREYERLRTR